MVKSISYRVVGSVTTGFVTFLVTKNFNFGLITGGLDALSKLVLFFVHERVWLKIPFGKWQIEPKVVWLTGLPSSGKTTTGRAVVDQLRAKGIKAEFLDGDEIRDIFPLTKFTKEARQEHVQRVGYLSSRLEAQGVFVVAALVSPYRESRDFVRSLVKGMVEVHMATPLEICEARDPKGNYKKARSGEIENFTGISDPYEVPLKPEITLDASKLSVQDSVGVIMRYILCDFEN